MPRWLLWVFAFTVPALAAACNDELVQEVDPDVCWSGLQWIGGKRGSEEMYPGRDCVGCHNDNDGPELIYGGTIYDFVDSQQNYETYQSGVDCFGVEGVRLEIRSNDGQVFETTTNRAGNFFLEGKQDDVTMPFKVYIYWNADDDGRELNGEMFTTPNYGGCGKCHGYRTAPEGQEVASPPPPDYVAGGIAPIGKRRPFAQVPGFFDAVGGEVTAE